jgi:hypothetical protein
LSEVTEEKIKRAIEMGREREEERERESKHNNYHLQFGMR